MLNYLTTPLPSYAYTLIGIGFVIFFALRGYFRGFFKEIFSVLSLVLIIVLTKPFGYIAQRLLPLEDVPEILHSIIAMTIGSVVGYVLIRFILFLIAIKFKLYRKWEGKAKLYVKLGGTIIGLTFGALLLIILSWYVLLVGVLAKPADEMSSSVPAIQKLILFPSQMMGVHLQGFKSSALGSFAENSNPIPQVFTNGINVISDVSKNPEKLQKLAKYGPIKELVENEAINKLIENEEIKRMAELGDVMGLLSHPDVQKLLEDPAIQETLKSIDPSEVIRLLESDDSGSGTGEILSDIMQNTEQYEDLIDDATVSKLMEKESSQKILNDPEIQKLIDEGNTEELLKNPDVIEFLSDPDVMDAMKNMSPEEVMKIMR